MGNSDASSASGKLQALSGRHFRADRFWGKEFSNLGVAQ